MKFSLRHLIAGTALVALAIQGYISYDSARHLQHLEHEREYLHRDLQKANKARRYQYELCRQVVEADEYPADFTAAERRFAALRSNQSRGD